MNSGSVGPLIASMIHPFDSVASQPASSLQKNHPIKNAQSRLLLLPTPIQGRFCKILSSDLLRIEAMAKETKRKCELCGDGARMYCDSDEASLCWSCDEKVHSANFLVAKHSRTLLCHACCSPTPWTASGAKLCRTISVCPACLDQISHAQLRRDEGEGEGESHREMGSDVHQDFIDSGSDYDSGYSSDEYEEEEGDENQVVPWSASSSPSSSPPPGPSSSSSNGDEGSFSSRDFSPALRKRFLDDQVVTSSSLLD